MKQRYQILPQEALKLIACVTMLIDHLGAAVVISQPWPNMPEIYYACRIIGRIAFPIYAFLLCEGMRHTKNAGRYILRLGVCILLAELPFDMVFEGGFTWEYQNVMVTLTLGAVMLLCMQKVQKEIWKLLLILPFALLAEISMADYGAWGIAMIAVFALADRLLLQTVGIAAVNLLIPPVPVEIFGFSVPIQIFGIVSMIPIALYSGGKLTGNRAVQWAFYLFYPAHLAVLWLISLL